MAGLIGFGLIGLDPGAVNHVTEQDAVRKLSFDDRAQGELRRKIRANAGLRDVDDPARSDPVGSRDIGHGYVQVRLVTFIKPTFPPFHNCLSADLGEMLRPPWDARTAPTMALSRFCAAGSLDHAATAADQVEDQYDQRRD